jgi:NAD(P)-dependent dehydrogenase (short-subunit alcohol dehydrogenase family)
MTHRQAGRETTGSTAQRTSLFDLTGHVAAVVGGGGVLGGALCDGLGSAGAKVAVLDRTADNAQARAAALAEAGIESTAIQVDARDRASVEAALRSAQERLGPVDILVNAAGINSSTPFFEIDLEEWHDILDTNLTSCLLCCQVFGRAMVERDRGGTIINISSASSEIPLSRVLAYSVSKAGVNILTRYLARELAPHRIRVNALIPGFFPAAQNKKLLSPARIESILARTPLARLGEPHELVGAAIWLASERASGFVTGSLVTVDGGFLSTSI